MEHMERKTTDELRNEIKTVTDIEDYLDKNKGHLLHRSLPTHLNMLLFQKKTVFEANELLFSHDFPVLGE